MNRFILLLVTSGVLLAVILGLSEHPQRKLTLVDFLPQETVAVVESKNGALAYRQAQESMIGRIISRKDFPGFIQRFSLTQEQISTLVATTGAFNSLGQNQGIFSLISRKSIIALLPLHSKEMISLKQISSRLLFLHQISPEDSPSQLFSRCFGTVAHAYTTDYQGQRLTQLHFQKGTSLTYFTSMDVLVWSFDEQVLRPCINQMLQHLVPIRAGMQKHVAYSRLKKHAGRKLDTFVYMRFPALQSLFGCTRSDNGQGHFPCPNDVAFFSTTMAKGNRFALVALADQEKIDRFKNKYHLDHSVENAPLGRLSTNTAFALWTNWFKANTVLEEMEHSGFWPLQALVNGWSEDMNKNLGLSLADFFALFGNEFSLYIDQVRAPNTYPRSLVSAAIEVRDRHRISRLLQQMTRNLQKVEFLSEGMNIVSLVIADGLLKPAYSLASHHLIVADSAELIERIHDKVNHPESRVNQSRGVRLQRSNFFLFLRTGDMIEWLLPVVTTIGKEFGGLTDGEVNNWLLFHPLVLATLSDLKTVETSRIRAFIEKNELFFEAITIPVQN